MRSYPAENWKRLGAWVHDQRLHMGWADMQEWAAAVGRSTRQLQGLERGESVGEKTVVAVARVLQRDPGMLFEVLTGGEDQSQATASLSDVPTEQLLAELQHRLGASTGRALRRDQDETAQAPDPDGPPEGA